MTVTKLRLVESKPWQYFTKRELKDVRPVLMAGFEAMGVQDLATYVKEQFGLGDCLTEEEIDALFSEDIKIDRKRFARLVGNIEGLTTSFIIEVARDTIKERERAKRNERRKKRIRSAMKKAVE